jgi:hypothetical protein
MKKTGTAGLTVLLFLSLAYAPARAQQASDILEKMIEASGGRKALEGIKDTSMSGDMNIIQMGMSATVTMYHKEPHMSRQDIEVMGMLITQAFDGNVAWFTNPQTGAVEEMPPMMLEYTKRSSLQMGNAALLHPEKFGIKYEFKGKESIEGKDYFVLTQAFENGDVNTWYVNADSYLLHKMKTTSLEMMGGETEQELVFTDYKKVNGIMAFHSLTIYQDGAEFGNIVWTEVKFNSGLDDALFKMEK